MDEAGIVERVRAAMSSTGMNQVEFSSAIGLDPTKLSRSLSGARRLTSLEMARIAEISGVTVDWLLGVPSPPMRTAARTSGSSAATDDAVREARRLLRQRMDINELLPAPVAVAQVEVPSAGARTARGEKLAEAALQLVREQGIPLPIEDLPAAIEMTFGIDVRIVDLESDCDGVALRCGDTGVIVVSTGDVLNRQRFTLAHELAHILARDDQELHIDVSVQSGQPDLSELQANAFAAAFLMPADVLRAVPVSEGGLPQVTFDGLIANLKVSPSALAHRLCNLGIIDPEVRDQFVGVSAATALSRSGRRSDRYDWLNAARSTRLPMRLLADLMWAFDQDEITLRPLANLLGRDVEELRADLDWHGPAPEAYTPAS